MARFRFPTLFMVCVTSHWVTAQTNEKEVVRAYFPDLQMVQKVADWRAPWLVNRAEHYLLIDADSYERAYLERLGFDVETDEVYTELMRRSRTLKDGQKAGISGFPCYRTVEETHSAMATLQANHPHLAQVIDIGDSWEKTQDPNQGYDLLVLRLTNSLVAGPKPKLFAMGGLHAREYTPPELLLRFAESLLATYPYDADTAWLLETHEIHLLLIANPDGRKQAETGDLWRKNTNDDYCSGSTARGADLNRNFPFQWDCCGGASDSQCSDVYRGPNPASEPETQAVRDYVRAIFPDQKEPEIDAPAPADSQGVFIDFHSFGQFVLWPYGFDDTFSPNDKALRSLGRKFAYFNGYSPEKASESFDTDGTTDDFAHGDLGVAAFTFEMGTWFFETCANFENTVLPDNLDALKYAAKVVRAPYLLPAGPEVLEVNVPQSPIIQGDGLHVEAFIDDTRFANTNGIEPVETIAGAYIHLNTPPWLEAEMAGMALSAMDGVFDTSIESVDADVDTSQLPVGRHTLYLQAQDSNDQAGAVTAAYFWVTEPNRTAYMEGTISDAETGLPLRAAISDGQYQTQSDPISGYYFLPLNEGEHTLTITLSDYETEILPATTANDQWLTQNVELTAKCTIFSDDVEAGNRGWFPDAAWSIISTGSENGSVWQATTMEGSEATMSSAVFNFSGLAHASLRFQYQATLDGAVEWAAIGSENWTTLANLSQTQAQSWTSLESSLEPLADAGLLRFRFRLAGEEVESLLSVDNIIIQASGSNCEPQPLFEATAALWPQETSILGLIILTRD